MDLGLDLLHDGLRPGLSALAGRRLRRGEVADSRGRHAWGWRAGTKYNALISWIFLSGAVCFLLREGYGKTAAGRPVGAVIFFLVALAVVSPWLVKNLVLKGNPDLSPHGHHSFHSFMAGAKPLRSWRRARREKAEVSVSITEQDGPLRGGGLADPAACLSGSSSRAAITRRSISTAS
ncbi:MAG: hypothetical protein MZV70_68915 [Desulfobacterales bacterium]|nr:hypothetical protein [Desulfobacterales bacterium]